MGTPSRRNRKASQAQRSFAAKHCLYATVLRATGGGMTSHEIAAEVGAGYLSVLAILRRLHDRRLIHIEGWSIRPQTGRQTARWRFGAGEDAPFVHRTKDSRRPAVSPARPPVAPRPEMIAFCNVMELLREPIPALDLAEQSGLNRCTAQRLVRHARAIGLVFVAEWHYPASTATARGLPVAAWQLGISRANRARPVAEKRAEVVKRSRAALLDRRRHTDLAQVLGGWRRSPSVQAQAGA